MKGLTVGADPELMLINKDTGKLVSAIPLLVGTKGNPTEFKYGVTMRDNVNAEFAIKPAATEAQFTKYVREMLKCLKTEIGPYYAMVPLPSAVFPKSELLEPEAKIFGCDPDFNSWTWKVKRNEVPVGANTKPFRSCGGHIHIGKDFVSPAFDGGFNMLRMVQLMDLFVGIPSVIIDCLPDAKARRILYGKAGCYRPKPYGVEWRTASNYWIGSPELTSLVYNLTEKAVNYLKNDKTPARNDETGAPNHAVVVAEIGATTIQNTINTSNTKKAKDILNNFLVKHIGEDLTGKIFDLANNKNNRNLEDNWEI